MQQAHPVFATFQMKSLSSYTFGCPDMLQNKILFKPTSQPIFLPNHIQKKHHEHIFGDWAKSPKDVPIVDFQQPDILIDTKHSKTYPIKLTALLYLAYAGLPNTHLIPSIYHFIKCNEASDATQYIKYFWNTITMSYPLITVALYSSTKTVAKIFANYWYQLTIFHKFYSNMSAEIEKAMNEYVKCFVEREQYGIGTKLDSKLYSYVFNFSIPDDIHEYKEPAREGQHWIHTYNVLLNNEKPTIWYTHIYNYTHI